MGLLLSVEDFEQGLKMKSFLAELLVFILAGEGWDCMPMSHETRQLEIPKHSFLSQNYIKIIHLGQRSRVAMIRWKRMG